MNSPSKDIWIQNISLKDAVKGIHNIDDNTVCIQIVDRWNSFPRLAYKDKFIEIHKFDFQDIEKEGCGGITDVQAEAIAKILQDCYDNNKNIVVHCHAGICRSGAVAEVAGIMGFTIVEGHRIPNVMVKTKLLKYLGYTNSWDEEVSIS